MTRYDIAYLALTPPAAGYIGYRTWRQKKYRYSLPAMLGKHLSQENLKMWAGGSIWVHAVSVGEVIAAKAMLPYFRQDFPDIPILLTTHTETGQAQAKLLEGTMADAVRFFPFDYSWVVRQFAQTYRPKLFIPMETELWPNALNLFSEFGAKIFVLNGKISERSFRSYSRARSILREPLSRVTAYCVQTEADLERVRYLTDAKRPVYVTGNCKFDTPVAVVSAEETADLRKRYRIRPGQPVVVVGSTHPGEEELILDAWQIVRTSVPDAVMLLAPRHPERFNEVWQLICKRRVNALRSSNGESCGSSPIGVVLVDEMGVLSKLYALSTISVVAGSFVDGIGGHNLQEAAAHGVPVIRGPYMRKQPDMVRILTPDNGGIIAGSSTSLAAEILTLLRDPQLANQLGELGRDAFARNRGSALRNMEVIRRHIQ